MTKLFCIGCLMLSLLTLSPATLSSHEPVPEEAAQMLPSEAEHRWDSGEIITYPTCTDRGMKEYRCQDCGEIKKEVLPALGHVPREVMSCTEDVVCVVCGETMELGHDHAYAEQLVEPTHDRRGYTVYTCSVCWDRYLANFTKPIRCDAECCHHEYVSRTSFPTCTEGGYVTHTCRLCGDSYSSRFSEPAGHKWDAGTRIAEPGPDQDGVVEYTCQVCGEIMLATIPANRYAE